MEMEIVTIEEGVLEEGELRYSVSLGVTDEDGDAERFGQVSVWQALGLMAVPWSKDGNGSAEGCLVRGLGGSGGVVVGGRDNRVADMAGALEPGDTSLVATHPNKASQIILKGKKRKVVLATKDNNEEQIMLILDGEKERIQVVGLDLMISGNRKDGWVFSAGGSAGIQITKDTLILQGQVLLGGRTPIGYVQFSPAPIPVVGATGGSSPAPGVFIGG